MSVTVFAFGSTKLPCVGSAPKEGVFRLTRGPGLRYARFRSASAAPPGREAPRRPGRGRELFGAAPRKANSYQLTCCSTAPPSTATTTTTSTYWRHRSSATSRVMGDVAALVALRKTGQGRLFGVKAKPSCRRRDAARWVHCPPSRGASPVVNRDVARQVRFPAPAAGRTDMVFGDPGSRPLRDPAAFTVSTQAAAPRHLLTGSEQCGFAEGRACLRGNAPAPRERATAGRSVLLGDRRTNGSRQDPLRAPSGCLSALG